MGTRQSNTNQHGSIDFDAAAVTRNSLCDDEMAKPIEERTKMFPKMAGLLRKFYKQEQKWVNQEGTMRQIIQVPNANGVSCPVLASHEIIVFRDELRQEMRKQVFKSQCLSLPHYKGQQRSLKVKVKLWLYHPLK